MTEKTDYNISIIVPVHNEELRVEKGILRIFGNISIPGIDATSGSLGHGPGIGIGYAFLAMRKVAESLGVVDGHIVFGVFTDTICLMILVALFYICATVGCYT